MNRHPQHASRTSNPRHERQTHRPGRGQDTQAPRDPTARGGNRPDRAGSDVDDHSNRNEYGYGSVATTPDDDSHPRQMGEFETRDEGRFGEGEQGRNDGVGGGSFKKRPNQRRGAQTR